MHLIKFLEVFQYIYKSEKKRMIVSMSFMPCQKGNFISKWKHKQTKTTELTIEQQLETGVRDFEFCFDFKGIENLAYVVHPSWNVTYTTKKEEWRNALNAILKFARFHEGENIRITLTSKKNNSMHRFWVYGIALTEIVLRASSDTIRGITVSFPWLAKEKELYTEEIIPYADRSYKES